MKKYLLLLLILGTWQLVSAPSASAQTAETLGKKVYECKYLEDAPYGVTAWSTSALVKDAKNRESRFVDYNSDAAKGLILDATTERDAEKSATAAARSTAFYSVYNSKGWYLYIEAEEPQINALLDNMVDPASAAHKEGYEIFFAPGLDNVPYYQIFTRPFADRTDFFDWGIPHRDYRSLKDGTKVESLPLKKGFGTFMFVPWQNIYERIPTNGGLWRFSIIRWMPFGKAGGVSWGGQVHDTGNFGLVRFQAPTPDQKVALEKRLLRTAWFKYLSDAKKATTAWSDDKVGDPVFYEAKLKPLIEQYTALGNGLGHPDDWNSESVKQVAAVQKNWLEFPYHVSELRAEYLLQKRLTP